MNLILDKAGRVVIPKLLREELNLGAGDSLLFESDGEQITVRPVRAAMPIQKENGLWVYRSGKPTNTFIQNLIEEGLDERHHELIGRKK